MASTSVPAPSSPELQDLTDLTFQRIHGVLARYEFMDPEPLQAALHHRASALKVCHDPFHKPSNASRKAVESGSVTLRDGTVLEVTDEDKELVWDISAALDLDEIEALTLFRLFIFNEGVSKSQTSSASSLLDALTDFYLEERLFVVRTVSALLRLKESPFETFGAISHDFMTSHIPNLLEFATTMVEALAEHASRPLPKTLAQDARSAARWAKQNLKEQLAILEVIFWSAVAHNADGEFVLKFFETANAMDLGANQVHADVLLDEECAQLYQDIQVMFGMTAGQLLKLDKLLDEPLDLELTTKRRHGYIASPADVDRIHTVVNNFPEDPRYSPLILAWGFVVVQISALSPDDVPPEYQSYYSLLNPPQTRKGRVTTSELSLSEADAMINRSIVLNLLPTLSQYLQSPIFSTSIAAAVASSISDPNNEQYRYILKSLMMALVDCVKVEYLPDYETLVDVWTGVFGRGEMPVVVHLCSEFWTRDVQTKAGRRSLLDLATSRFPVEITPLMKLLRGMSGTGGLEALDSLADDDESAALRVTSAHHVYDYFGALQTYTQILPQKHISGPMALYETRPDPILGYYYTNTRPVRLPGGSELPVGSRGRVITTQGATVVSWSHSHSGWRLVLDILRSCQNKRFSRSKTGSRSFDRAANVVVLGLEDIGIQFENEAELVADILDLFRCLLLKNLELTARIVAELAEADASLTSEFGTPPDLIQVTLLILKDALVASGAQRASPPTRIVASALGVLTALLPSEPGKVWPFLRSLPQLFGDERQTGTTPLLLSAERSTGTYHMTIALLDLIGALFDEAFRMVLTHPGPLQHMKTDVLLRALSFIHSEIWVEHASWKYLRSGDRLEIGRKVANIYGEVLKLSPPLAGSTTSTEPSDSTLAPLTRFVLDIFLLKATASTIHPLVSSIATVRDSYDALYRAMSFVDVTNLRHLLEANLRLAQLVLVRKQASGATRLSLLEQTLLSGLPGTTNSFKARGRRLEPIDIIANLVRHRTFGHEVAIEAIQLLSALCASVATTQPTCPSLVGHISDPEGVAVAYVGILGDAYENSVLRQAVWDFVSIVVDTQPAFASLFVFGRLHSSKEDGTAKTPKPTGDMPTTALAVACDMVASPELWEITPMLQSAALGMLDLVWQHALQHIEALAQTRGDKQFWKDIATIASKELGDPPSTVVDIIENEHAFQNDTVIRYAYHTTSKAHALHILALDMKIASPDDYSSKAMPPSASAVVELFKSEKRLATHIQEAIRCSFAPEMHDKLQQSISTFFPSFTLDSVRVSSLPSQRTFGDSYLYQSLVVHNRLMKAGSTAELAIQATGIFEKTCGVNLDWSLTDAQIALMRSWKRLLQESGPYVRKQAGLASNILASAADAARAIAAESRSGEVMRSVHAERLALLQGLLEVVWLASGTETSDPIQIAGLLKSARYISSSDVFPPLDALRRQHPSAFHHTLLRIIYFCAQKAAPICAAKSTKPDQRLSIGNDVNETLAFVVEALRSVLDLTFASPNLHLDGDLKLLVAVFERCTKPELHVSPSAWLARCQEVDLIRASLEVFVRSELAGGQRSAAYAQHVLYLHLVLARLPASAERLAHEGVIAAYAKTDLAPYLKAGTVEPVMFNHPGEYSQSHRAWRTMVGVTTNLVHVIGGQGHFINTDIVGFVQLYGAQLTQVLAWTAEKPLSLGLLEEIHRVAEFFHAIATCTVGSEVVLDRSVHDILKAFVDRALFLLQQLNYALSHPNHLATLLEPVTSDERVQLEKEANAMSIEQSIQAIDSSARPLLASTVQLLLTVVRDIVSTVSIVGNADGIFCTHDTATWSRYQPEVSADNKVLGAGPATLGTLRELATFSLDIVRHLSKPQAATTKATVESVPSTILPFNTQHTKDLALQVLEQTVLYAVTQLASTVHQPIGSATFANDMMLADSGNGMELDGHRPAAFQRGAAEQFRMTRQWKDMAIELNILAKDVPHKAGWGAKEFFDEVAKSTYTLVQTLDRRLKEGR